VPRNFSHGSGVIPSLAERGGSSLVSMGTTSLECSVLKCGQATQRTINLATLQDSTFKTGSTHADKTAPPPSTRDGMTPLPWLKLRGTNSSYHQASELYVKVCQHWYRHTSTFV
jgi:hypothetical protein